MFADVTKYCFGYGRRDLLIVNECPRAGHDQIGNRVIDHRLPLLKKLVLPRSRYLRRVRGHTNLVKNADRGIQRNSARRTKRLFELH